MSLSQQRVSYKEKYPSTIRLRPVYNEGRYIRSLVVLKGLSFKKITDILGVSRTSIHCVIYGKRRSARIESEIARILGKASWNDVVLEARSEVQKKPVEVIKQEIEQRILAVRKAAEERMAEHMAHNADRVKHIVGGVKADKRRRGA